MLKYSRPAFLLTAAALGFCALSCTSGGKGEVRAEPEKPVTVAAAKVTRQSLTRTLVLSAEFRPYQEIEVHAKVAGFLKQIFVDVGDHVKAGQQIALLEVPEMNDEAVQAAAMKKRAQADLARARSELERARSAHQATHLSYQRMAAVVKTRPGLVAQQEIDDALARDRVSESQVSTAQAAISSAEQQVEVAEAAAGRIRTMQAYERITAPFAGVVSKRYADTGAMIQAGTASQSQAMPVIRLSQNDRLRLILPVPESIVSSIRPGEPVEVRVGTLGRTFRGRVARFSDRVSSTTRTMDTEVDVDNPRFELMPGMYAEANITLEQKNDALALPIQAVAGIESKPTVLAITAGNRLQQREVKVGIETPDHIEIVEGLDEGDLVVIGKQGQLKPGQTVEPKLIGSREK